jgi:membrane protein required for colicin V production
MNWVDAVVVAVLVVSTLIAVVRGFAREVLGLVAWAGAVAIAVWGYPFVAPRFNQWIGDPNVATAAAYGTLFLVSLIFLSIVTGMLGGLVRASPLSGLDTTLGLLFGVLRGALLLVAAYIALGFVVEPSRWPAPLQDARSTPWVYQGAVWAAGLLPPAYRPVVKPPPVPPAADVALKPEQLLPPLQPPAAAPTSPTQARTPGQPAPPGNGEGNNREGNGAGTAPQP